MATTAIAKMDTLKDFLRLNMQKIEAVLPRHLNAERALQLALASVSRQPELLQCSQTSILRCVLDASQLGLELNNSLGFAYIIPYRSDKGYYAQMIPGYKGLVKLARNTGAVASIEATLVYPGEHFSYQRGTESQIDHKPDMDIIDKCLEQRVPYRAVYAVAHLRDGRPQFEVMTYAQVQRIRSRSRAATNGPWVTDQEEMAKKTAVRRLYKLLPIGVEMALALAAEDRAEGDGSSWADLGIADEVIDIESSVSSGAAEPAEQLKSNLRSRQRPQAATQSPNSTADIPEAGGTEERASEDKPSGGLAHAYSVLLTTPEQLEELRTLAREVSEARLAQVNDDIERWARGGGMPQHTYELSKQRLEAQIDTKNASGES